MKKVLLAITLSFVASAALADDVTDAFIKCATTANDRVRLACYDNIGKGFAQKYQAQQAKESGAGYKDMDLIDLKADIKSLTGKKVRVRGSLQMMGEIAMLRADPMDMTPVMINIDKLPRDDRKQALKGCVTYCGVQVAGRVTNGPLGQQLTAESVVWK